MALTFQYSGASQDVKIVQVSIPRSILGSFVTLPIYSRHRQRNPICVCDMYSASHVSRNRGIHTSLVSLPLYLCSSREFPNTIYCLWHDASFGRGQQTCRTSLFLAKSHDTISCLVRVESSAARLQKLKAHHITPYKNPCGCWQHSFQITSSVHSLRSMTFDCMYVISYSCTKGANWVQNTVKIVARCGRVNIGCQMFRL